jgi:hypothetical protein
MRKNTSIATFEYINDKRQHMDLKTCSTLCCLREAHYKCNDRGRVKEKGLKKINYIDINKRIKI